MTNKEILEQNGAEIAACLELADKIPIPQEKEVTVNENGVTEILPDTGRVLSKVTVTTEVAGGGAELNIAYGDTPPADTTKMWVKTTKPSVVIVSSEKVYEDGGQAESLEEFAVSTYIYGSAWAAVGEDIYLFGGRTSGTYKNTIRKLNVKTRTETTLSQTIPSDMVVYQAIATYGTKIYLFGGRDNGFGGYGSASKSIVEFDCATQELKTLTQTLPAVVAGACCAVVGSKAYIFGGDIGTGNQSYGTQVDYVTVFDLETHEVRLSENQLPVVTAFMSCCAVGDKIYLFGGISSNTCIKSILSYDTVNESFDTLTVELPIVRHSMGCAIVDNVIVLIGGNASYYPNVSGWAGTVWYFDPFTHEITDGMSLVSAQQIDGAVVVGKKIYGRIYIKTQSTQVYFEFSPELGTQLLDRNTLQIYPAWERNVFAIFNSDNLRIPIGVDMVHRGNENDESVKVEALLYEDDVWTPI
jgi:N-acetylneuraminic acid mutarotase